MRAILAKRLYLLTRFNGEKMGWRKISSLSYMHHVGNDPLHPSTVGRVLEKSAIKYEDREAVISVHQNKSITFEEAYLLADKLAAGLREIGLKRGDRVAIWSPNTIEWYISMMACARAGFIMVAVNPAYEEPEIEYALNKVKVKALVCPSQFRNKNYYEMLSHLTNLADGVPGKLHSNRLPFLETVIMIDDENKHHKSTFNYEEILNLADEASIKRIRKEFPLIQTDDGCNIQFTSGTTGKPKAALVSHFSLVNNAYELAKRNELNLKHHKICVQVPLFHAFGICITTVAALHFGATMVLPSLTYNPSKSLEAIYEEKCTVIHGTPTMYVDLIKAQSERLLDIHPEIAVCGGAPCSPHLFNQMIDVLGVKKVKSAYGLTETTAVVFQSLINEDARRATSTVGHVSDHVEVKVIDKDGRIVPRGQPGELCIRSYATFLEYWGDDSKTKEIFGNDRWLKTGDEFVLQEDGYGKIIGRIKDMIIRGGENIYPKEIEDVLNTHPDVIESQVIGIEDERLGEVVCACLRIKDGRSVDLKDLQEFCKGKIAHFKIPTLLHVLKDFPKTTSGKIQKFKIKQQVKSLEQQQKFLRALSSG